ncbi:hypothetical protein [[Mycoplasma] imitans]|uniref:hypothetical protein n=1 Tax=[Mycoplasma] imitans TaxID=29560 RepID=UPI001FDFF458|nr:hypothetical protein [[Mycoplasma] imitans]
MVWAYLVAKRFKKIIEKPPTTSVLNTKNDEQLKNQLNILISSQSTTVQLYEDYRIIRNTLNDAYEAAKAVMDNPDSTSMQIEEAINTLREAINKASADKTEFDNNHSVLVAAYNRLKAEMQSASLIISSLNDDCYSAIKANIAPIYDQGKVIIANTLQSVNEFESAVINNIQSITNSISKLANEKQKADDFLGFKRFDVLSQNFVVTFAKDQPSPQQYSAVGYSVDNSSGSFRFASRKIWINPNTNTNIEPNAIVNNSSAISRIGWIYSLAPSERTDSRYEFSFDYFGPPVGYLYFPYKSIDQFHNRVFFDYRLNGGDGADQSASARIRIPTTVVDRITVARLPLTKLRFGTNTISIRTVNNEPIPLIGNMYVSSAPHTDPTVWDKIYNDIFGNTISPDNPSVIKVNLLKGYGLANSSSIVFRQFYSSNNNLTLDGVVQKQPQYLIGNLGGSDTATDSQEGNIRATSPTTRNYIFYVNALRAGSYHISGIYNSGEARSLEFRTNTGNTLLQTSGAVRITNLISKQNDWTNTLKTFDTAESATTVMGSNRTLKLTRGLNKIIVSAIDNQLAPNLGNLTFTLAS